MQRDAAADGMSHQVKAVDAHCFGKVGYEIDEFQQIKAVVSRFAVAEAGEVGDIDPEIFRERFGIFAPGPGALTSAVNYQQWFALAAGEIAYVEVADRYCLTTYVTRLPFLS